MRAKDVGVVGVCRDSSESGHTMSNPARGYTWPPFERGNQAAVTHGVFASNRAELVQAEVEAIAEQVADRFPWTGGYEDERRAYARALCDEKTVRDYLDQVGPLDQHHTNARRFGRWKDSPPVLPDADPRSAFRRWPMPGCSRWSPRSCGCTQTDPARWTVRSMGCSQKAVRP